MKKNVVLLVFIAIIEYCYLLAALLSLTNFISCATLFPDMLEMHVVSCNKS